MTKSSSEGRVIPISYQRNTWLADAYAAGLGEPWQAPGSPVGTSVDRSRIAFDTSSETYPDGTSKDGTAIYEVATGKVVHELPELDCASLSQNYLNGTTFCTTTPNGDFNLFGNWTWIEQPIVALDVASGKITELVVVNDQIFEVGAIGISGDILYSLTSGRKSGLQLVAINMATHSIEWSQPTGQSNAGDCTLIGEHIGCAYLGHLQVFSTTDGSLELELTDSDIQDAIWTDEGVIWGPWFAEEHTISFYDGHTETTTSYPHSTINHPSLVMPLAEAIDDRGFSEIDSTGRVVVGRKGAWAYKDQIIFETGAVLTFNISTTITSSESGVAFTLDPLAEPLKIIDNAGTVLGTVDTYHRKLHDGILVSTHAEPGVLTTTVFPPFG